MELCTDSQIIVPNEKITTYTFGKMPKIFVAVNREIRRQ